MADGREVGIAGKELLFGVAFSAFEIFIFRAILEKDMIESAKIGRIVPLIGLFFANRASFARKMNRQDSNIPIR